MMKLSPALRTVGAWRGCGRCLTPIDLGSPSVDGGDDGKFHRACPSGGSIDLRQVCRDDMSGRCIPLKGLVHRTADQTSDESIHSSLLPGTYIEDVERSGLHLRQN